MLSLQWGQGTESSPTWRSPKLPLRPQSATRSHRTPSSAPYPLARMMAPHPPGASERRGPAFSSVSRSPLLLRQPRSMSKDGCCLDSETASQPLSVCLSLAQRKADPKNQREGLIQGSLGLSRGLSANSEAQLREQRPAASRSGELRERKEE